MECQAARALAPFVGREADSRSITELCALALDDSCPVAAAIIGEPGIGKSRLLVEVSSRLKVRCVPAAAFELAREVPLIAASEFLRDLSTVPEAGIQLSELLLGQRPVASGMNALRIFEAAYRCLATTSPRVFCLDDAQWADPQSLALVDYLLRAAAASRQPFVVLCAGRPSAVVEDMRDRLHRLLAPRGFRELRLQPLGHDEGVEMARRLDPRLTLGDAEALWMRAQGSPFWLEALARNGGGPTSAQQLIGARYRSLDSDQATLFALLIVAARPLSCVDLGKLLSWGEQRVRRTSLALVNRGLVTQEGMSVRIGHDLIREGAARELPETERARLHGLLASWFEEGAGDDIQLLREALEHRRAAGIQAADLALRLARSPQRRLLGEEGLVLLAEIAQRSDGALALQREVVVLAGQLGQWELALERAAALSERAPDRGDRARAALEAARAAYELQRVADAHAFLARVRSLNPNDPLLEIEADACESQVLRWLENRVAEAEAPTVRAATTARRIVADAGGVDALSVAERRAYLAALRAELDASVRAADGDAVIRLVEEIEIAAREPDEVFNATFDALFVLFTFVGRLTAAEARIRRLLDDARRLVMPAAEAEAMYYLANAIRERGRLDEAEHLAWEAVSLVERAGAPDRLPLSDVRLAAQVNTVSRGDWRRGAGLIAEDMRLEADPHLRLARRRELVHWLGRFAPAESAEEIRAQLSSAWKDADAAHCERCRWETVLVAAEAQTRLGDGRSARAALDEWDSAHPAPLPGQAARRAHVQALVTATTDPAASLPLFEAAAAQTAQIGRMLERLWIRRDMAAALEAVDRSAATDMLRHVAADAEEMGALSERQLAVQMLRGLGVRTWGRAATSRAALTDRELKIATLVAGGASNPEIAGSLFLSRKTVERHVSNILGKLGARNRTELASLLTARGSPRRLEGASP